MFKSFGPLELILVLAIVMLVFGAGKLPSIGRSLGQSIREFRKGFQSTDEEKSSSQEHASKDNNTSTTARH